MDDERAAMRSVFGISILLGSTSALMAHEAGCRKMELLAIDDGNEYAAKLVKYYTRLGFETVRVVGENGKVGARVGGRVGDLDLAAFLCGGGGGGLCIISLLTTCALWSEVDLTRRDEGPAGPVGVGRGGHQDERKRADTPG